MSAPEFQADCSSFRCLGRIFALPDIPDISAAIARIMELSYPPATLSLPPAKALGHRLAAPVGSRNPAPSRPFALTDGFAVAAQDVVARRSEVQSVPVEMQPEAEARSEPAPGAMPETANLLHENAGSKMAEPVDEMAGDAAADHFPETPGEDPPEDEAPASPGVERRVQLGLRPMPQSARREDALAPGYAVAIGVGDEVPRGADYVIPMADCVQGPLSPVPCIPEGFQPYTPPARMNKMLLRREARRQAEAPTEEPADGADGADNLGQPEPLREWDLVSRYQSGQIEVPVYSSRPAPGHVPIGSWARQREDLLPERALLRPGEVALLEAMGVDEVEVYRRPVVGIASLAPPLPVAQRKQDSKQAQQMMVTGGGPKQSSDEVNLVGFCPLTALAVHLCRSADLAALPLGTAPQSYRPLAESVLRWLGQVDILLLVGGSHFGPRCLSQDLIAGQGDLRVAGTTAAPCQGLSAGLVEGRPVFAIPGGLPELLSSFVLFVRPLAHKYNPPLHFSGEVSLALENGSQLHADQDSIVPVRYGWSQEYGMQGTRYSGQRGGDPWLAYVRGQALIQLEGGRQYRSGEVVRAFTY